MLMASLSLVLASYLAMPTTPSRRSHHEKFFTTRRMKLALANSSQTHRKRAHWHELFMFLAWHTLWNSLCVSWIHLADPNPDLSMPVVVGQSLLIVLPFAIVAMIVGLLLHSIAPKTSWALAGALVALAVPFVFVDQLIRGFF